MNDLIKYGWIKAEFNTIYKRKFHRISTLMRIFKSQEIDNFEYVLVDEYFIDKNNSLYFIANNEIYKIDLNDEFNFDNTNFENDYKKIKFICKYSLDDIFKHELVSDKYKRDKRINEILKK
jgi:hypothetical protein